MAFSKTPTKGMRDFLPAEYATRQKAVGIIADTYAGFGFNRIETPSVENIELLCSKQGGDNEKLIFAIQKRGEKLARALESGGQLCDLGLRYDLTVPLARYYANNCGQLPSVFKAMQIDYVWRADRPQKGRYKQFMQCDIDIIGEASHLAEVELIVATSQALCNLNLTDYTIHISDRRILTALANKCEIDEQFHSQLFVSLDKLDKIGVVGVIDEIKTYLPEKALEFIELVNVINGQEDPIAYCQENLTLPEGLADSLATIIDVANSTIRGGKVAFDITLVRGMGYYTGTIYEVYLNGLGMACGGGGRYDKMIGRITGTNVPACGFSLGFERLCLLLEGKLPAERTLVAIIIGKDVNVADMTKLFKTANQMRDTSDVTMVKRIKNFAYQLKQLRDNGCTTIYEYVDGQLNLIKE